MLMDEGFFDNLILMSEAERISGKIQFVRNLNTYANLAGEYLPIRFDLKASRWAGRQSISSQYVCGALTHNHHHNHLHHHDKIGHERSNQS